MSRLEHRAHRVRESGRSRGLDDRSPTLSTVARHSVRLASMGAARRSHWLSGIWMRPLISTPQLMFEERIGLRSRIIMNVKYRLGVAAVPPLSVA